VAFLFTVGENHVVAIDLVAEAASLSELEIKRLAEAS